MLKYCHDRGKKQKNVAAIGINADFTEMDVDSYLSPIPCKSPGGLWSRYSNTNNNNYVKSEHESK